MVDLLMKKVGRTLIPADADSEEWLGKQPNQSVVLVKHTNKRRPKYHNWFMKFCDVAFECLPMDRRDEFDSPEYLRKYAECAVKFRHVQIIEFEGTDEEKQRMASALELSFRAERKKSVFVWARPHRLGVAIIKPRSISFDELDQDEFEKVSTAVKMWIEDLIGMSATDLMQAA